MLKRITARKAPLKNILKMNEQSSTFAFFSCQEKALETLQFQNLVRKLASLSRETEWLELKHNNADPYETGEYISALSNAAGILGKHSAYIRKESFGVY